MSDKLEKLGHLIGNTPLKKLDLPKVNLFIKLEYHNASGSIKDRAAYYIIQKAIQKGYVHEGTIVVESSSGNFAISLSTICTTLGIQFIPVIDPNINSDYETLLKILNRNVIKVTAMDSTGGYLLTRIDTVKKFCQENVNSFWPNQYENVDNYLAYYNGLGNEICNAFKTLDYAFIGVSSGGTITGLSRKLKEVFPNVKVIAVDVEGSVIFGQQPRKRYISGIGASKVPPLLQYAHIDEVVSVSHDNIFRGAEALLKENMVFGGASTGAVYWAIKDYFSKRRLKYTPNVVFLCTDKGNAYLDTVYNDTWKKYTLDKISMAELEIMSHMPA